MAPFLSVLCVEYTGISLRKDSVSNKSLKTIAFIASYLFYESYWGNVLNVHAHFSNKNHESH